jgi:hypothetical protein
MAVTDAQPNRFFKNDAPVRPCLVPVLVVAMNQKVCSVVCLMANGRQRHNRPLQIRALPHRPDVIVPPGDRAFKMDCFHVGIVHGSRCAGVPPPYVMYIVFPSILQQSVALMICSWHGPFAPL